MQGYASHSLDTGIVWSRPHAEMGNAAAKAVQGRQMHEAWVAFIRGGEPWAERLPAWPTDDSQTRRTMIFEVQSHVETKRHAIEMKLWNGVL